MTGRENCMKRFMKTCAVIAAVLCLLGLLLGVTASSLRGRKAISEVVEKVTGGWVHVNVDDFWEWSFSVGKRMGNIAQQVTEQIESVEDLELWQGVEITDFGYDVSEKSMFEHGYKLYKGNVSKYCPGEQIVNLDVNVGGCVFETKASADDKFYIEVKNANKFQGYVEDETLYIKAADGAKSWNKTKSCRITLYVPGNFSFGSVEVAMGAGTLAFSELKALEDISLEVGAGQIVVERIQGLDLELEIGAGEIRLRDMEAGELAAEIGLGSFKAEGSVSGNVDISCSMGNVDLNLSDSEESFDYLIQCAMGNIDLGGGSYSGLAKEKKIQNGAARTMEIECSMGNVKVTFDN